MVFSSLIFLYAFLPLTLILYFAVPRKFKNSVLLIASLAFYWWGEPKYVYLMIAVVLMTYLFGLLIEWQKNGKAAKFTKLSLALMIVGYVAVLGYFKYADFFLSSFAKVTGISVKLLGLALPIGISFYIFQALSYVVDVYRGDVPAQKNPITLAAYVTMFPQLIAGPIVRYSDIEIELKDRTHSFENASLGIRRFIIGLAKKVLFANVLGELCSSFTASNEKSVLYFWLYAIAFMLQIYFDFSGYSDMAIGLGRILGFKFPENFDHPYVSRSVTEFWRRWHMTLGSWFRDYVYIPMGGNRVNAFKHVFNIFVVWMLTGLWHGANWNFVLWGLYFAVLLLFEKYALKNVIKKGAVVSKPVSVIMHIYVVFAVLVGFIIFDAPSAGEAASRICAMFGAGGYSFASTESVYVLRSYLFVLIFAIIGSTPLPEYCIGKLREKEQVNKVLNIIEPIWLVLLLLVCTAYLVDGSFNPFLYFRF